MTAPKPTTKKKGTKVSQADREAMFKLYAKLTAAGKASYEEVGRHFGRSLKTVHGIAKREGWKERINAITQKVQHKTDKDIARSQMTNSRIALAVRNKTIQNFLVKGKPEHTTATDCVKILELCDRMGVGGEGEGASAVNGSPEAIESALKIMKALGDKGLKALGDWIAKSGVGDEIQREVPMHA